MLENYTLWGSEASSDCFSSLNQKGVPPPILPVLFTHVSGFSIGAVTRYSDPVLPSQVALKLSVHLHFSETEMTRHTKNPVPIP